MSEHQRRKRLAEKAARAEQALADKGLLIEAGWVGLKMMTMPDDAPSDQLEEMRNAFFAGARHVFTHVIANAAEVEMTDVDLEKLTILIQNELDDFITAFTLKHLPETARRDDGEQMVRVGDAAAGSTPFVKLADGTVKFDGRGGRDVDYGHSFDPDRGYRVFFGFKGSAAKNTWSGESLLSWAIGIEPGDDPALQRLVTDCRRLAKQVNALNAEWIRQGRPENGIVEREGGRA